MAQDSTLADLLRSLDQTEEDITVAVIIPIAAMVRLSILTDIVLNLFHKAPKTGRLRDQ